MKNILYVPFIAQLGLMFVDEFKYHQKRGLPKWERLGHPLDTFSVLCCYGFALLFAPTPTTVPVYIVLSVISCLMITKDEWVHHRECVAEEQWIHACLFIIHPIALACAAVFWPSVHESARVLFHNTEFMIPALCFSTGGFLLYQIVYWNFLWKQNESTQKSTAH